MKIKSNYGTGIMYLPSLFQLKPVIKNKATIILNVSSQFTKLSVNKVTLYKRNEQFQLTPFTLHYKEKLKQLMKYSYIRRMHNDNELLIGNKLKST